MQVIFPWQLQLFWKFTPWALWIFCGIPLITRHANTLLHGLQKYIHTSLRQCQFCIPSGDTWYFAKLLRGRRFEICDFLPQLLELCFSRSRTAKPSKYENEEINVLGVRLCYLAIIITGKQVRRAPKNREKFSIDWKSDASNVPNKVLSVKVVRSFASALAFWEDCPKAQSNVFFFSVLKKPLLPDKDCPFYGKRGEGALFAVTNTREVLVETLNMFRVHGLIIWLTLRDNAFICKYLHIAYTSTEGVITTRAKI